MASSTMVSSAATVGRAAAAQSSMVAPFTGLKSTSAFPVTRKNNVDFSNLPSNGGRVQCMKVWPVEGLKKFETLSYLPPLTTEQLIKQIEYLLRSKWIPCLEFSKEGFVYRKYHASPGYYDGRY
ncbi:ribulose-1,5-bisphosphate carboxylase small subunit, partial [Acinetobacter baumannii]|uniref:ribulose-1,5-bisphosphate carboxylase small subunit n=1 Tax=Acinetobacter baumannii TaxID=470 RepID=UPI003392FDE9